LAQLKESGSAAAIARKRRQSETLNIEVIIIKLGIIYE
jgi:hypothetical protein